MEDYIDLIDFFVSICQLSTFIQERLIFVWGVLLVFLTYLYFYLTVFS